jgi:hypothetical protein
VEYENGDMENPRTIGQPITYWLHMNSYFGDKLEKKLKKVLKEKLEKQAKIIRNGSASQVTDAFLELKLFENHDDVHDFFNPRPRNNQPWTSENLEKARKFLGVCYVVLKNTDKLVKLQALARGYISRRETGINPSLLKARVNYQPHIEKIEKIQRWWRHWRWLRNLPVSPKEMRERFIPNINKIKILQRAIKNYVHDKIRHSHNCPYSGEDYWKIEKKNKIVYKYQEGNNTHWRYYDLLWLHEDFIHQTAEKRFVVEPATKKEFPEEFVVEVARAAWIRTRLDNCYLRDDPEEKEQKVPEYNKFRDWNERFPRRSLYCFSMMLFDIAHSFGISLDKINPIEWRKPERRYHYQNFYLRTAPILFNIARSAGLYEIENEIYYRSKDVLSPQMVFPDEDNMDIMAGEAIFGVHLFLVRSSSQNAPGVTDFFKSSILGNFMDIIP